MMRKCLVLSIVWIALLSLTSIRAPLAEKYKGPAADGLHNGSTPQEETVITRTSAMVLRNIAQARADIRDNAPEDARHEIDEAEDLLRTIRNDYSPADDQAPIAIDAERPVLETEKYIIKAGKHLDNKNADKADGELVEAERKAQAIVACPESPLRQSKEKIRQSAKVFQEKSIPTPDLREPVRINGSL